MKKFTIIKTGYSSGIYGCSNEYFTCIYINSKESSCFRFRGLYGAEERIEEAMKKKGYIEFYASANYGKIPSKERNFSRSEKEAIEYINNDFENNQNK